MLESYAYLLLSLWFLLLWLAFYLLRRDLRHRLWRASIIGGFAGFVAELWYFADYWRPPTVFGVGVIGPDDFLVGFAITGVAIAAYDVVFRKRNVPLFATHARWPFALILLGGMLLLVNVLGYNSCLVSDVLFLGLALRILLARPDLWKACIFSGLLTGLSAIPAYLVLFTWLLPEYWDTYWILENPFWRSLVWYEIPLTEILWYASWGCLAGIFQNFIHGTGKVAIERPRSAPAR